MSNLFTRFRRLIPTAPLLAGEVVEAFTGGAVVELPDGGRLRVRGDASLGDKVFVRDGVIESEAPDLPTGTIEI